MQNIIAGRRAARDQLATSIRSLRSTWRTQGVETAFINRLIRENVQRNHPATVAAPVTARRQLAYVNRYFQAAEDAQRQREDSHGLPCGHQDAISDRAFALREGLRLEVQILAEMVADGL